MTNEEIELKPCPFCGKKPKIYESEDTFFIGCMCGIALGERYDARGESEHMFLTKNAAIEEWNTRLSPPVQPSGLEFTAVDKDYMKIKLNVPPLPSEESMARALWQSKNDAQDTWEDASTGQKNDYLYWAKEILHFLTTRTTQ